MAVLIVVNRPGDWPLDVPGVQVVDAREYLTDPSYSTLRGVHLFNLCRSYAYQSTGYYVSLLGAARRHRPVPSVGTLQDLRLPGVVRATAGDLDAVLQRALRSVRSPTFTLSIYFGRALSPRHDRLARALHALFPAPLLRAQLIRAEQHWMLRSLAPIAASDIPASHHDTAVEFAQEYFARPRLTGRPRRDARFDLALLVRPDEAEPPSDERALRRFTRAAEKRGIRVTRITADDYGRLLEFDALFIRETTQVNHHTFRFARRAEAEGLVVMDDPSSIIRATNKVFLAELLGRHSVPAPRTVIGHSGNLGDISRQLAFPCILKVPDGSFSTGVFKVESADELQATARRLLESTDLFVAQEFVPTEFDWRIGVLGGEPLHACKYHMAGGHWQIINPQRRHAGRYGRVETLAVEEVPGPVVRTALRAARLIGDGLYGVDLKHLGDRCLVMEVNDNPTLEGDVEDRVLGSALYDRIVDAFVRRLESRKASEQRA